MCKPAEPVKGQDMLGEGHLAQALPVTVTVLEKKGWYLFWQGNTLTNLLRHMVYMEFFISFFYLQHLGGQTELSPQLQSTYACYWKNKMGILLRLFILCSKCNII